MEAQAREDAVPPATRRRPARSSSTPPRARWSAPARSSRTRATRASPTSWGRRATACTPARAAAGTATSPSCPPTTTAASPPPQLENAQPAGGRSVRRSGGRTGPDLRPLDREGRLEPGGAGAAYDFAVLHVKPEQGAASPWRRRSAPPLDGQLLRRLRGPRRARWAPGATRRRRRTTARRCTSASTGPAGSRSTRRSPTMYRIGCTMTGGSSGGGWFATGADGKPALVSNTSIGPVSPAPGWRARGWARAPKRRLRRR